MAQEVVIPGALGTVLAGFLSDLFLIPMIMLFLLGVDLALLWGILTFLAENVLSPMMGRGLNISPTVVCSSFIIWAWLLGGPGAFLALPITLFVAVMFGSFPEKRWLASLLGVSGVEVEHSE